MSQTQKIKILLIEDSEDDIELTKEALLEGKINNTLSVVRDGEEALKFLKKENPYSNAFYPDIILLDLNLPKLDGKEVLRFIKNNDELKKIPVIVLTTSKADKDILESYNLYANSYVNKPIGFDSFVDVIKKIEAFWFNIVKLPTKND